METTRPSRSPSVDPAVVDAHQVPVGGQAGVALQRVRTGVERGDVRPEGVLGVDVARPRWATCGLPASPTFHCMWANRGTTLPVLGRVPGRVLDPGDPWPKTPAGRCRARRSPRTRGRAGASRGSARASRRRRRTPGPPPRPGRSRARARRRSFAGSPTCGSRSSRSPRLQRVPVDQEVDGSDVGGTSAGPGGGVGGVEQRGAERSASVGAEPRARRPGTGPGRRGARRAPGRRPSTVRDRAVHVDRVQRGEEPAAPGPAPRSARRRAHGTSSWRTTRGVAEYHRPAPRTRAGSCGASHGRSRVSCPAGLDLRPAGAALGASGRRRSAPGRPQPPLELVDRHVRPSGRGGTCRSAAP